MENFVEEQQTPQSVTDESQAGGQDTLSEALAEIAQTDAPSEQAEETVEQPTQEPVGDEDAPVPKALRGRIKASERRGYERGKQEVEERYKADLEELNSFRLERDVKKLAEEEKISESLARRLLLAERGQAAQTPRTTETTAQTESKPSVQDRAQTLYSQAQTIEAATGLNVMEIFQTDVDVHRKIVSGEWDFTDVAKQYGLGQSAAHAPAPARSANRAGVGAKSIRDMSDEEFARLDSMLDYRSIDTRR